MYYRALVIFATSIVLSACGGGGDDDSAAPVVAASVQALNLSAVPTGAGAWDVSYPDVKRIADTCYPAASLLTFSNVQADGHAKLFIDAGAVSVGDPATILANLPACP